MNNQAIPPISDFNADLKLKGFKVYEIESGSSDVRAYKRKGIYKICMVTGKSVIHYAAREMEVNGTTLFFGNPYIPYSWEILSKDQAGYTCLFTEDFLKANDRSASLQESPLFKIDGTPIFQLSGEQRTFIVTIFQKMISEHSTDYVFKSDLIRNYINLLLHEAMKMQPADNFSRSQKAAERVTSLFLDLLERQFPIESMERPLALKTAHDFAKNLSVHVNSLNRSVKEITGKPTTTHIAERIVSEAKALLQHTDWNIADIAYSLGFEYPTYFNNYFKRITGTNPKSLRAQEV